MSDANQKDNSVKTVVIILAVAGIGMGIFFPASQYYREQSLPEKQFFVDDEKAEIHNNIKKAVANYTQNPRHMAVKVSEHCWLEILESEKVRTACSIPEAKKEKDIIQEYFNKHPFSSEPSV